MITLLHPSRGRPEKAYNTYKLWLSRAKEKNIEYILGIDEDDKHKSKYIELFKKEGKNAKVFIGNNNSLVECTNKIARLSKGDILIYLSDDFECPVYWDVQILRATKDHAKFLLKVDDCVQPFHQTVLTIPIMSRTLYSELGYFWFPEYKSMFCDVDLYHSTKKYHIYAPELRFRHDHWLQHGKVDETYKRSESNWKQGQKVWEKRQKENKW
jgi:hypothetical protein